MTSKSPSDAPARDEAGDFTPPPTPAPPVAPGGIVAGKYQVERVIGFGGMGVVCAATHLELATPIAIKFVRAEHDDDDRAVARFMTEARAAARLQSQYSCKVMDVGRLPSGGPYIVMEYLSGENLQTRLERGGPMDCHEVATLALQACEALAEAHVKHLVHRDIKPENLFVTEAPDGSPLLKVLDFGISKQVSPLVAARPQTDSMESVGSPYHMSPEQMTDPASVDARSDIWSLGVVMYEVLTGQLPFAGLSAAQLCVNVMTTQPLPPQAHRAEIPDGLARVLLRCLDKDRDKRFTDVGELAQALTPYAGAAGALSADRVERTLGRTPEGAAEPGLQTAPPTSLDASPSEGADALSTSIPGVPRRGLGLRLGVVTVLVGAAALAALAVQRSVVRAPAVPVAVSQPPVSVAAAPALPAPSVVGTPEATPQSRKKVRRAATSAPRPSPAPSAPPAESRLESPFPTPRAPELPAPVVPPDDSVPTAPRAEASPEPAPSAAPTSTVVYPKIPVLPALPAP